MHREMKEEITSQKKLFIVKNNNVTAKDKRPFFIYFADFEQVFVSCVISFIFFYLIINHKHKCIQAKTFKTQVS